MAVAAVTWAMALTLPPEVKFLLVALCDGHSLQRAARQCDMRYMHAVFYAEALRERGYLDHEFRPLVPEPEPPREPKPRTPKVYISKALREAIYERDGYRCVYCHSTERLSLDHIFPESRGGETTMENLRVLCMSCNCRKGAR